MRAVKVDRPGAPATITEVDDPGASDDEAIVRMLVAGVQPVDGEVLRGEFNEVATYPRVLGVQGVGLVDGAGSDERVMFFGAYGVIRDGSWAERTVVSRSDLIPVPGSVSDERAAAFLLPAMSAFGALRRGGFRAGQSVLVPAVGGAVGGLTVQLAHLLGASIVVTTAGSTAKAEQARAEGIDHVVDLTNQSLNDEVMRFTDGKGVDLVVDTVGGSVFADGLAACAPNATIVSVGAASSDESVVTLTPLRRKLVNVVGFNVMWLMFEPGLLQEAIDTLLPLLASGDLTPRVAGTFPLAEADAALTSLRTERPFGSYVLQIA